MALQKKNNLISSHIIVLVFWFVVLFLVARGFDLASFAEYLTYALMTMTLGALCGVTVWVAIELSRREKVRTESKGFSLRGVRSTIGSIPMPKPPKTGNPPKDFLEKRFAWWQDYQRKYPLHANAFRAVLGVFYANPELPASPVPGGHGGATLIEHSCNVVDTIMELAPKWTYCGHRNKRGEIIFPLLDATKVEFLFSPNDPVVPLTAFAHDIGKTVCYRLEPNGTVTELKKKHDIEGAKLLRTMPEIMNLPLPDRTALLSACEYYHHINSMPLTSTIDDRARALTELLIAADILTGKREGGKVVDYYEYIPSIPGLKLESETNESDDEEHTLPALPPGYTSAIELAYSILLEPGRVNGSNVSKRIAWKYGEWVYINDLKLRKAIADLVLDSRYAEQPHRGVMHPFTLKLMSELSERGMLMQEHAGRKFSEKRAIYTIRSGVLGDDQIQKYVIVAKTEAFPALANIKDCRSKPDIIKSSWGEQSAINKKALREDGVQPDGIQEDVEASDQPAEPTEPTLPDDEVELTLPEDEVETALPEDEVEFLLFLAREKKIPYSKKKSENGHTYIMFQKDIVLGEMPNLKLTDERIIHTVGESGNPVIAVCADC